MSTLKHFNDQEKELVIGLFFRVGMWISLCDDSPGTEDDEREYQSLIHILKTAAKVHEKSDFVKSAVKETVALKDYWPKWSKQTDEVLKDCKRVINIIRKHTTMYDLKVYKTVLYKVAETVALAYGEFGTQKPSDELISAFMEKSSNNMNQEEIQDKTLNISMTEEAHLKKLKAVLLEQV